MKLIKSLLLLTIFLSSMVQAEDEFDKYNLTKKDACLTLDEFTKEYYKKINIVKSKVKKEYKNKIEVVDYQKEVRPVIRRVLTKMAKKCLPESSYWELVKLRKHDKITEMKAKSGKGPKLFHFSDKLKRCENSSIYKISSCIESVFNNDLRDINAYLKSAGAKAQVKLVKGRMTMVREKGSLCCNDLERRAYLGLGMRIDYLNALENRILKK